MFFSHDARLCYQGLLRRDGANGRSATSDSRYNLSDMQVKGAWSGPARLGLVPHVNAPVADLPVS